MKHTGETKVHKTLTMPISFYALVEQIRSKQGLDTAEDAIKVSVMQLARRLGLEAWLVEKERERISHTLGKFHTALNQVMDYAHSVKLGGIDNEF